VLEIPNSDWTVEAEFVRIDRSLSIAKTGTGSGSVSCGGGACPSTYPDGTQVILAASAAAGSTFTGWSAGGCSGTGVCVVTLHANTTVAANFDANPVPGPAPGSGPGPTPTPEAGDASAAGFAAVKGGRALVKLICRGEAGVRCQGAIELIAPVKQGKKTKNTVIAKGSYDLPAKDSQQIVPVKFNAIGKKLVKRAGKHGLKVKVTGDQLQDRMLKLRQQGGA
jgi:Divergent InlB B-repeat domain